MRQIKKWILLLGTVLVVVGAAVLPQRLSQARDRDLFNCVNAEETVDTLFSPADDLTKRLELLARWSTGRSIAVDADDVDFTSEVLPADMGEHRSGGSLVEHSSNLEQRALDALHTLAESIPELAERIPQDLPGIRGERRILCAREGMIASYINFSWYTEIAWQVDLTLDETTEKVLALVISSPAMEQSGKEESIAQKFLEYLGVTGGNVDTMPENSISYVKVTGTETYCYVSRTQNLFVIRPIGIPPGGEDGSTAWDEKTAQYEISDGTTITKVIQRK